MTVADLSNMEAVVEVDENDVVLVSVGDTALVSVDAFSDEEFKGIVSQIGNSAQSSGFGTQEQVVNFEVKIKLIDIDPKLRPGMSCNSDIETETVFDVISVPIQSVTVRTDLPEESSDSTETGNKNNNGHNNDNGNNGKRNEPQEVVFLVENGESKIMQVKTGISDDNYLEIKDGLDGGEDVVSGSYRVISRELEDGSKVRVEEKRGSRRNSEEENN